ncbi:MAG: replication initiation protein [Enterococcus sp.]|uniref:replication initiation protein n=1 Tax=Enterococcaceae TaxID=81852 RepID=UPI0016B4C643|nr:replication initiation protein [Enterococcus durans]MBT9718241.1 RepB family plasmid replication initiator protein [Enterococcus durans]NLM68141.1 replication initiation protein [Enterococcus sp.]
MSKNKKANLALTDLLSRQNYLVVQGNDLAKSFGGLKSFEQRVLDYCFSYVTKDSRLEDEYEVSALEIIRHFNLNTSGDSYKRIAEAFKRLNENTALYLPITRSDGSKGIRMTQLFSWIDFFDDGIVRFKFSTDSAPYVLDLKEKFYSFRLGELSRINGKYALIMLKLWESNRRGKNKYTTISADLENWQSWFLGKDKQLPAGRFFAEILTRSIDELEEKIACEFFVTTQKRGRKVVGYEIMITDTSI